MESVFEQSFEINTNMVDCFGRLRPSQILYIAQEMGGMHCRELALDYDTLASRRLFWAVTRHRVQVTRLPRLGEHIRVETWALPTTRVAFPRSVVAYDESGRECFRAITLWSLMDLDTRKMILPGKSGIAVVGTVRGTELIAPHSLVPRAMSGRAMRSVCFTDLDRNGHMNNTRYMDWVDDLLPSSFHATREIREFTACYLAEAREGQALELHYDPTQDGSIQVDVYRQEDGEQKRIFTTALQYASH